MGLVLVLLMFFLLCLWLCVLGCCYVVFEWVLDGCLCCFGLVVWLLVVGMLLLGFVVVVLVVLFELIGVILLCL